MTTFKTVGIVGGGLIGMSWASLFVAKERRVVVVDPDPSIARRLDIFLDKAWPDLLALGLATQERPKKPIVSHDYAALQSVDFVQENGPENLDAKRAIIVDVESAVRPDVLIASSTSSLRATDIQAAAKSPERILVAHPMNPPHLVPMVEIVAGDKTAEVAVAQAERFYQAMQRVCVRAKREVPGHLANRLTSALYREAVHMVAEGIATVEDIDKAIAYGPGMRWALMGPHLTYHLGGGQAGYRGYLDHLGPTQEERWRDLGHPKLSNELKEALINGVERELVHQDEATLTERRDKALVDLLKLKTTYGL